MMIQIKHYCTISVLLSLLLSFCVTAKTDVHLKATATPNQHTDHAINLPKKYNAKLYDIAYHSFLANNNVTKAYQLSLDAVKHNPESIVWRKRLAKVAIWNDEAHVALKQWLYLADVQKSPEALVQGIKLAESLDDHEAMERLLKIKLGQDETNIHVIKSLAQTQEELGFPKRAIDTLATGFKQTNNASLLEQEADIYDKLGEITAEDHLLKRLLSLGKGSVAAALRLSQLAYKRGNLVAAQNYLVKVQQQASLQDKPFWATLARIAWLNNDDKIARHAYLKLYQAGALNQGDASRLVILLKRHNPQQAFKIAHALWNRHHQKDTFFMLLDLGIQLQQWDTLRQVYQALPKSSVPALQQSPYYWSALADVWQALHNYTEAKNTLDKAIAAYPKRVEFKVSYLWLLINNNSKLSLIDTLIKWHGEIKKQPQLWTPAAMAYVRLGLTHEALTLLAKAQSQHRNDALWLIGYADVLTAAKLPNEANKVKAHIVSTLTQSLTQHARLADHKQIDAFVQLALASNQGSAVHHAMLLMQTSDTLSGGYHQALARSIAEHNTALTDYLRHKQQGEKMPAWAELSLALQKDDRQKLAQILKQPTGEISYAHVAAAKRLNKPGLVKKFSAKRLQQNPNGAEPHRDFTENMLKTANMVDLSQSYYQAGGLKGPYTELKGRLFVAHSVSLLPLFTQWWLVDRNNNAIANVPNYAYSAGLGIRKTFHKWYSELFVIQNKLWKNFVSVIASAGFEPNHRWTFLFNLAYNKTADQSTGLRIAGTQDVISADMHYQFMKRNAVSLALSQVFFHSQQGRAYLGNGQTIMAQFTHTILLAHPHLSASLFTAFNHTARNGTLQASIRRFIPTGTTANLSFFIPPSFFQWGITLSLNQQFKDGYTHAWRPFALASVFQNSDSGIGYVAEAGFAGSVFGRDHLSVFFNQSKNQNDDNETDRLVGMRYQYFFS